MVAPIVIATKWPPGRAGERDAIDASLCELTVRVNDVNVTAYQTEAGVQENSIEIPTYYWAEWIAENWWALLWEPCKTEDGGNDPDYLSRHWIPTAQHGFVLPSVQIVPTGERIKISAIERQAQYADARFMDRAEVLAKRDDVEFELKAFVQSVLSRVRTFGTSPLQEAWTRIETTDPTSHGGTPQLALRRGSGTRRGRVGPAGSLHPGVPRGQLRAVERRPCNPRTAPSARR